MDEFWAGKLTMRGADEVQSCTLISMLCDGAPIGVQEGVWVSLTRNLSRHSPPPWGEVAQKGKPSPAKLTEPFLLFIGSGAFPGPGKAPEPIKCEKGSVSFAGEGFPFSSSVGTRSALDQKQSLHLMHEIRFTMNVG